MNEKEFDFEGLDKAYANCIGGRQMNKYALKVLISPSWWIRNYPTSRDLDKVYRYLLDHKDEVNVIGRDPYNLDLSFRGRRYSIWWANFPYAYLSRTEVTEEDGRVTRCGKVLPTRATAMEFYEVFGASPEGRVDGKYRKADELLSLTRQPEKTE